MVEKGHRDIFHSRQTSGVAWSIMYQRVRQLVQYVTWQSSSVGTETYLESWRPLYDVHLSSEKGTVENLQV